MHTELNDGARPDPKRAAAGFVRRHAGGLSWEVRAGAEDPALLHILESPEAAFRDPASILKAGRSAAVARSSPYVVKRFHQKRAVNRILDRLRRDRARRSLVVGAALEALGIPTPRALAAASRTRAGLVSCSYLVTDEIQGARTLVPWLQGGGDPAALEEIGALVARLHAAGWSHRDLKATNLLVDSAGRPHFVDLDGLRKRRVTESRRAADLARLLRDLRADRARSDAWIEALFRGYGRHAPESVEAGLRGALGFARPNRP